MFYNFSCLKFCWCKRFITKDANYFHENDNSFLKTGLYRKQYTPFSVVIKKRVESLAPLFIYVVGIGHIRGYAAQIWPFFARD
jgi:hypothetical protein